MRLEVVETSQLLRRRDNFALNNTRTLNTRTHAVTRVYSSNNLKWRAGNISRQKTMTKISYDITFYLGNLFHRRLAGKSWLRELSIIPTHGAGTATTVRVCANRYYSYNKISTLF